MASFKVRRWWDRLGCAHRLEVDALEDCRASEENLWSTRPALDRRGRWPRPAPRLASCGSPGRCTGSAPLSGTRLRCGGRRSAVERVGNRAPRVVTSRQPPPIGRARRRRVSSVRAKSACQVPRWGGRTTAASGATTWANARAEPSSKVAGGTAAASPLGGIRPGANPPGSPAGVILADHRDPLVLAS
jgi:hypothetical protein